MSVYVDTSAFLAVLDSDDNQHPAAARTWRELLDSDEVLISTSYVLVETLALVQRRLGMDALRAFQQDLYPLLDVVWIGEPDHLAGMDAVLSTDRRRLSLVDCVSFDVVRRRRIVKVFCLDPHFREQGFDTIPEAV